MTSKYVTDNSNGAYLWRVIKYLSIYVDTVLPAKNGAIVTQEKTVV